MSLLGVANDSVGLLLRHLTSPHHVLHEVASAFNGEPGQAGRSSDYVFHRTGNLAPGFLTDELRALRHLGHRVAHVRAPVTRASPRYGCRRRLTRGGHGRFIGGLRLFDHVTPSAFISRGADAPKVSLVCSAGRHRFGSRIPEPGSVAASI
jgi:hypothetical protein